MKKTKEPGETTIPGIPVIWHSSEDESILKEIYYSHLSGDPNFLEAKKRAETSKKNSGEVSLWGKEVNINGGMAVCIGCGIRVVVCWKSFAEWSIVAKKVDREKMDTEGVGALMPDM